ncbi:MAG: nitrilase-related carbon-nitrogen hydrolase [Flavobacteriaceae bacterium]
MRRPTIALWSTKLTRPFASLDAWIDDVDAHLERAAAEGADLLMTPEYWVEQWLSFKPGDLTTDREIGWMGERAAQAVEALQQCVADRGVALLAGTMPWPAESGGCTNRAWLLLPDGRAVPQDKLVLTPSEKDRRNWNLETGGSIAITEWNGWRIAVLICLDIEVPALSVALAPHRPDLVLVPSMTSQLSGYSRVYSCARARAVEMMTTVAVCGCVGPAVGTTYNDTNVSGAAVYIPCEKELGYTGILAEHPPVGIHDGDGPWLVVRDIPVDRIRALRDGGAEVWPGTVPVGSVKILDEAYSTSTGTGSVGASSRSDHSETPAGYQRISG